MPVRCGIRSGVSASEEVRVSVPVRCGIRSISLHHGEAKLVMDQEHFIASRRSQNVRGERRERERGAGVSASEVYCITAKPNTSWIRQ